MILALGANGHSPIDIVNLLAVVFGVLFSIRRSDIARRTHEMYPEVEEEFFDYWKATEKAGWGLAAVACVLKIVADLVFRLAYVDRPGSDWKIYGPVGFAIFVAWIVAIVVALLRVRKGRIVRAHLGIDLNRPLDQAGGPPPTSS